MSILRSSHPPTLSPLLSPAAASTSTASSSSSSLTHRLLNKKKPSHASLSPPNSPSFLRSRARSAWSNIFAAPPTTQISRPLTIPIIPASVQETMVPQLSISLQTDKPPPSETTVGKRISFSDSVVFSSPKQKFSSSSTTTTTKHLVGRRQHHTLPVPISSSVLCNIPERTVANSRVCTSDTTVSHDDKKLTPTTISDYEFLVGASWAPKPRDEYGPVQFMAKINHKDPLRKKSSGSDESVFDVTIPKMLKTQKVDAGEDAFFGTRLHNFVALGVADGVGGWVECGVDPSEFAWSLMNNIAATAMHSPSKLFDESFIPDPIDMLETGYAQVANQREVEAGSSTACIVTLCAKTGMLRSANLGDSSYVIIRDLASVVYQPADQQHFFNCPYQLTIVPPPERKKYKRKRSASSLKLHAPNSMHGESTVGLDETDYDDDPTTSVNPDAVLDRPRDADIWQESLKHGDVVVLATDGFFDNVDVADECIPVVRTCLARWIAEGGLEVNTGSDDMSYEMARTCAKKLTELAVSYQGDPRRMTPFAKNAKLHGINYIGGKIDDVTVLVAIVRRAR